MPASALALVLLAAATHASWNLFAKRAASARHFVWLYSAFAVVAWAPLVAVLIARARPQVGRTEAIALVVTAVLHAVYSIVLQRGYRVADLSLVYPIARGTGPLLTFVGAMIVLGERPTWAAAIGAVGIVAGVFLLAGGRNVFRGGAHRLGVSYAFAIGALVATYTVWDGWAVKVVGLSPIVLDYAGNCFRALLLLPAAWRDRAGVRDDAARCWREAVAVGVLGPAGYILVLYAMTLAPVSHIAPAREVSMLIAAWLGARVLDEGDLPRRLLASALIVAGVVGIAAS